MEKPERKEVEVNATQSGKKTGPDVWKRMMRNYAFAMVAGIALLTYLVQNLHDDASNMMLGSLLAGGLLLFGGGFGIVVSLVFHYINKK